MEFNRVVEFMQIAERFNDAAVFGGIEFEEALRLIDRGIFLAEEMLEENPNLVTLEDAISKLKYYRASMVLSGLGADCCPN